MPPPPFCLVHLLRRRSAWWQGACRCGGAWQRAWVGALARRGGLVVGGLGPTKALPQPPGCAAIHQRKRTRSHAHVHMCLPSPRLCHQALVSSAMSSRRAKPSSSSGSSDAGSGSGDATAGSSVQPPPPAAAAALGNGVAAVPAGAAPVAAGVPSTSAATNNADQLLAALAAEAASPDVVIDPRYASLRQLLAAAPADGYARSNFARSLVRGVPAGRSPAGWRRKGWLMMPGCAIRQTTPHALPAPAFHTTPRRCTPCCSLGAADGS